MSMDTTIKDSCITRGTWETSGSNDSEYREASAFLGEMCDYNKQIVESLTYCITRSRLMTEIPKTSLSNDRCRKLRRSHLQSIL